MLEQGFLVRARIVDEQGRSAAGARLTAESGESTIEALADASGRVELALEEAQVARAEGPARGRGRLELRAELALELR